MQEPIFFDHFVQVNESVNQDIAAYFKFLVSGKNKAFMSIIVC
jgi:hypothetical protein